MDFMDLHIRIVYKKSPWGVVRDEVTITLNYKDQGVQKGYYKTTVIGVMSFVIPNISYDLHVKIGSRTYSWYNFKVRPHHHSIEIRYDSQEKECTLN